MKYEAIVKDTVYELNRAVSEKISGGWEPIGGVSVACYSAMLGGGYKYAQSMILNGPSVVRDDEESK